jgi:protease-4
MGDVAASGGYFIAAPADKIVAEPATITGSIGVLGGKIVVSGLLEKLGVGVEAVQRGANASMYSMTQDYSPEGKQRLEGFLDDIYRGFKQHVAAGRHLSADAVEAIAKGRVWSGEDAREKGLVDELGGYAVALRLAKEAAHIPADTPFKLTVFPKEKSTVDVLYGRLFGDDDSETTGSSSAFERVVALTQAVLARIDTVGEASVMRMRELGEIR